MARRSRCLNEVYRENRGDPSPWSVHTPKNVVSNGGATNAPPTPKTPENTGTDTMSAIHPGDQRSTRTPFTAVSLGGVGEGSSALQQGGMVRI